MKKSTFTKIFLVSMLFASSIAKAAPTFFKPYKGTLAPVAMPMQVHPTEYQIFSINDDAVLPFLSSLSEDINQAKEISIPTPDGKVKVFKVWSTPLLSKELQKEYPLIQSFTGEDVTNNMVTLKLVYTHYGFSGQVYDGANTYIIQPYANANTGYYVTYFNRNEEQTPVSCSINDLGNENLVEAEQTTIRHNGNNDNVRPDFTHNTVNRKLRLSMSTTTEWSKSITFANFPHVDSVFAKVVEVVNRLNGYHEREIAISYELVSGKNTIFVNKNTDPFSCNDNMSCLLDENQIVTTIRVGAHNYDIGHILCTASGGLAALSSACNANNKARGATTLYTTTSINVLLHEMGHQYSANHTFSANSAGCSGNGEPTTAYESGSGVTIMSYSGSCPPNNVPASGEEYYHVHSLLEMGKFIQKLTCGKTTPNIPILFIPNLRDVYHIPKNTPFELEGPEATVQGSQIPQKFYYNWEQYDVKFDLVEAAGSSEVTGPTLRSHNPSSSTAQSYPNTNMIITGNYSDVGYRLPNVERDLHFKYTARGVLNAKGAYNIIDSLVTVKVAGNSADFRITSQNSGVANWNPGDEVTFNWNVGGTNNSPVNCGGVSIYLHYPDGSNSDFQLVAYAPNTGTYKYTVPDHYAAGAYIKIKGAGNIFFDVSKGTVNVNGKNSVNDVKLNAAIELFPNPATDVLNVTVNSTIQGSLNAEMYNVLGQKVWSGSIKNNVVIPTAGFARGNYILQIRDAKDGTTTSKKVILK